MNTIDITKPIETTCGLAARLLASDVRGDYPLAVALDFGTGETLFRFSAEGKSSGGRKQLRNKVQGAPLSSLLAGQVGRIVSARTHLWVGNTVMRCCSAGEVLGITIGGTGAAAKGTPWFSRDQAMVEVIAE